MITQVQQVSRKEQRKPENGIGLNYLPVCSGDLRVSICFFSCFLFEHIPTHPSIAREIPESPGPLLGWSSAMLLLKMLLLCEVCTLLLLMETLQSRHLPAQMDWLAGCCLCRARSRSCGRAEGRGMLRDTSAQARDVQAPSAPVLSAGSEQRSHPENLGHECFTFRVPSAGKRSGDFRVNISGC